MSVVFGVFLMERAWFECLCTAVILHTHEYTHSKNTLKGTCPGSRGVQLSVLGYIDTFLFLTKLYQYVFTVRSESLLFPHL